MTRVNFQNELIKRRFFKRLKDAEGCCDSTITTVENSLLLYDQFTKNADYKRFSSEIAKNFKDWVKKKQIAIATYRNYLRNVKKFFHWLSGEPGYKSKIKTNDIDYLNISKKDQRMANQRNFKNYPSLEYVKELVSAISAQTEIDKRDKALISFAVLTGMRDTAIATLPLGCVDDDTLIVRQNPKFGVETKFSKNIVSIIFEFDAELVQQVKSWIKYLKLKGFGSQDPLFPRSKLLKDKNNLCFLKSVQVEPFFWKNSCPIRNIFKSRSDEAKLQYYIPHSFRDLAIELALKAANNGEQIKAISQNFGHDEVITTFNHYANFNDNKIIDIVKTIDFSPNRKGVDSKKLSQIKKLLEE